MPQTQAKPPARDLCVEWLAHLVDMLGAEAGGMFTLHADGHHHLTAHNHTERAVAEYRDQYSRLDPLPRLLAERPAGRALVIDTTTHPAYVAQRELSADYLQPHGIDHVIATRWQEPDGTQHYVGVQRFRGAAPFHPRQGAEFDALIRHWRVGQALPPLQGFDPRANENRRSCDIAAQLPTPLAVVDGHLAVVWANPAARQATGAAWGALFDGCTRHREDIALRKCLLELIRTSLRQHAEAEALVPAADGRWFASAAPLRGKPGLALLRLTATHYFAPGLRCRLERLFNLTRTEAELTVRLAHGESPEAIACARGVSVETVRSQLRTVFRKTGTHRQGELVCLVGKVAG